MHLLVDLAWVVFWFVTLYASLNTAYCIVHERALQTMVDLAYFLATPTLWAIAIVFFFN